MRIISGVHKGRKIIAPNNLPIRPTTDISKESKFNILSNQYFFNLKFAYFFKSEMELQWANLFRT